MRKPQSVKSLENLGRERLSKSFYMRDFLYSEIANFHNLSNIPDNPDLAIANGRKLCEELLEPLNATFGRIAIRSAYRSRVVNQFGNDNKLGCASNETNFAGHIWDVPDADGLHGATACIVVPWFTDKYENGTDWRCLAYWIHDHLAYSELQFFPTLCAFNISWHERPKKTIHSYIEPAGYLLRGTTEQSGKSDTYSDFPQLRR